MGLNTRHSGAGHVGCGGGRCRLHWRGYQRVTTCPLGSVTARCGAGIIVSRHLKVARLVVKTGYQVTNWTTVLPSTTSISSRG